MPITTILFSQLVALSILSAMIYFSKINTEKKQAQLIKVPARIIYPRH
jgi:hypothetical protein